MQNSHPSSQADAMEYLTFLLDLLHEEMLTCQSAAGSLELPFNRDHEDSIDLSLPEDDGWSEVGRGGAVNQIDENSRKNAVKINNSTIISSIFHGTLRLKLSMIPSYCV